MKNYRRLIAAVLLAVMLLALAACGGEKTEAEGANITIGIYADTTVVTPFDPSKLWASASGDSITQFLYDSLYFVNAQNEYDSRIIESEEWTDDTHLTVKLKDGIYFSNGTQLTAYDWLFSLNIMKQAPVQTTALKTIVEEECSCSADGLTLNIVLSQPYAMYQDGMDFAIYSRDYLEACGGGANIDWYDPAAVVGSGPYSVKEFEQDGYIVFEKRSDYWGLSQGYNDPYDTLKVIKYNDQTTMGVDMENGAIDAAIDLSVQDYDRLTAIDNDKIEIGRLSGNNVVMLCLDSNNNEFLKDPAVREAICHSIDSAALAEAIRGSYGKAAGALLSVNELGYAGDYDYSYDPELARQILADAGYSEGDITLKIVLPVDEITSSTGEALQGYLSDIGIDLQLEIVEIATFIRSVRTPGGTDLKIDNKVGGNFMCDPSTHLDNWADPSDPLQYRDYCEKVLNEAVSTYDREARAEKYKELQDLWYENFDAVPLYETDQSFAYNSEVFEDFNINSTQDLRLLDVKLK